MSIDPNKLLKLPVWAQELLRNKDYQIAALTQERDTAIAALGTPSVKGSIIQIDPYGQHSQPIFLPSYVTDVMFHTPHGRFDFCWAAGCNEMRVSASRRIAVHPRASNVIHIVDPEYKEP